MTRTLEMQFIQYMNFFERAIGLRAKHCFSYNSTIFFVVSPALVPRALGNGAENLKRLSIMLRRKIRIIAAPSSANDAKEFISRLVYPLEINGFTIEGKEGCILAPRQSRAMIIGRNKTKLVELEGVLKEYFGIKKLRVI
ncbi:MAG: hypothetical protein V1886_01575 [archaeon]